MAKYEIMHDTLNAKIQELEMEQYNMLDDILRDADTGSGGIGGLLGTVYGRNGQYDLETIYLDQDFQYVEQSRNEPSAIACHLNYRAFEVDVNYLDLSFDERQQIFDLVVKELQRLDRFEGTYMLFGENACSWYAEEGIEAVIAHRDEDVYDYVHYPHNRQEMEAYERGVADGDGWGDHIVITKEDYEKLKAADKSNN